MEKVVTIDINEEDDFLYKYNKAKISPELMDYLFKEISFVRAKDNITLVINNNCQKEINLKKVFISSFNDEYNNIKKIHNRNNIIQLFLLFLGIIFIFLSFQFNNAMSKEIFLIAGWVPIWEMIDLELFSDPKGKRYQKILLKLMNCQIKIK